MSANRTRFIITVLFILCLVPSTVSSQIQRNFWGLEIGHSTKNDVKSFLVRNGWEYEQNMGGMDAIGIHNKVSIGGYLWFPSFRFYNNQICEIQLLITHIGMNINGEFTDESGNNTFIFYDLKTRLKEKYSNVENIVDPDDPAHLFFLRDDKSILMLKLADDKDVVLTYSDKRLLRLEQSGSDL